LAGFGEKKIYTNTRRTNAHLNNTTTRLDPTHTPFKHGLLSDPFEATTCREHLKNMTRINPRVHIKFPQCSYKLL
ncbi:MAG: hypothetical protein ACI89J_002380, partial [Hyphomicrobiaceae bacterium]